ncbi:MULTISPECIES: hypothetical protein [Paraburkholderia]|uniref:hypothetical protein n=1 Tax=Paraburkholderia TaxID=1822464 RepID=UPI00224CCC36|nr:MULTISPECIES: hypothetical protein [Paraburkholderia]MCX4159620.1 hypothetical protein [Paraburkholderia aspalathi]MDN7169018.1 hypothetical protein [Paraburkholderia sp. SECH2]MDQ6397505.1 hypothetical protein [Paraburkholderia aspalathi]
MSKRSFLDTARPSIRVIFHRVAMLLLVVMLGTNVALALAGDDVGAPSLAGVPLVAKSAKTVGVKQCYEAVHQISERAVENAVHQDVLLDWDRNTPDTQPFFSMTGLEFERSSAAFSLTAIPSGSRGACTVLAERISSASSSCNEVARLQLTGYKPVPLVGLVTVYTTPTHPRETVTLIDTKPSCLIIRRQVKYDWVPRRN